MRERRVVVSGMGAITPFGIGVATYWDCLARGKSAASPITTFDVSPFPTRFAANVPLDDDMIDALVPNQKSLKTMSRAAKFIVGAAEEAVADAGLDTTRLDPFRFGVSLGSGGLGLSDLDHAVRSLEVFLRSVDCGEEPTFNPTRAWKNMLDGFHPLTPLKALPNIPAAHLAINHNARGNCQTITTACTSSAQSIGEAYRQIRYGVADVMLTGGGDAMINPNGLASFCTLGVLSRDNDEYRTAARPFDRRRNGFMLGEGSAIVVLEEYTHCMNRGGTAYAEVIGYASTCDAYRLTDEPPEAWSSTRAMQGALDDAGLAPTAVQYVNAHGTGTQMNDRTETHAIRRAFGDHAGSLMVSSTKSMIGHLVAAAGAAEFIACVQALRHQLVPPTINYRDPDEDCDLDYVPNVARPAALDVLLSNSFGFGGQNASIVLRTIQPSLQQAP